jgi:hypothetical protein
MIKMASLEGIDSLKKMTIMPGGEMNPLTEQREQNPGKAIVKDTRIAENEVPAQRMMITLTKDKDWETLDLQDQARLEVRDGKKQ